MGPTKIGGSFSIFLNRSLNLNLFVYFQFRYRVRSFHIARNFSRALAVIA